MRTKHQIIPPNPVTSAEDIVPLVHALTTARTEKDRIANRTLLEQAAGRKAVLEYQDDLARNELAQRGFDELRRRFGKFPIAAAAWELREDGYWVDVLVKPADGGDILCFTEGLDKFPSEDCIASIALVVE